MQARRASRPRLIFQEFSVEKMTINQSEKKLVIDLAVKTLLVLKCQLEISNHFKI
jgi:hypothetical protein